MCIYIYRYRYVGSRDTTPINRDSNGKGHGRFNGNWDDTGDYRDTR